MSSTVPFSSSNPTSEQMIEPYTFNVRLENKPCQVHAISIQIFPKNSREEITGLSTCRYTEETGGMFTLDKACLKSGMRYKLYAIRFLSKEKCAFPGTWSGKAKYLLREKVTFPFPETSKVSGQNKKPLTIPY